MLESFDQMALINSGRLIEQMDLIIDGVNRLERRIESLEEQFTEAERRIKLEQQWRNDKFGWRYD